MRSGLSQRSGPRGAANTPRPGETPELTWSFDVYHHREHPDRQGEPHQGPQGRLHRQRQGLPGRFVLPPFNLANPHELPTVEIKGAEYIVQPIPAGECGVSAVRLTKLASRESY